MLACRTYPCADRLTAAPPDRRLIRPPPHPTAASSVRRLIRPPPHPTAASSDRRLFPLSHPTRTILRMDLGPIIRIIEIVPAALPAEREPRPEPAEPTPAKEPTPV
jgi:hypothetical protein